MYESAHAAIRANPEHVKKQPKKSKEQKRWNKKKLTNAERKHRIANKKAYLLHLKNLQEAQE